MQTRESNGWAVSPLASVLARSDEAAHRWLADRLLGGDPIDPAEAPPATEALDEDYAIAAG